MKIKILSIFVIVQFIFIILPSSVFAGDEQNPEIIDDENDMFIHPCFNAPDRSLKAIDILSGWFNESQNEPDYLFITIKVVDLNYLFFLRSGYVVVWDYNYYDYIAYLSTQFLGLFSVAVVHRSYPLKINLISASFDKENNLVTFKIPKNLIGNLQPGDVLTSTRAFTFITVGPNLLDFYLAADYAPDHSTSGKDYIIQY